MREAQSPRMVENRYEDDTSVIQILPFVMLHEKKTVTREESLEDVNRTNEALWIVPLTPGEERRLTYKYSVLVYR